MTVTLLPGTDLSTRLRSTKSVRWRGISPCGTLSGLSCSFRLWKSTHLQWSGRMKYGSRGQGGRPACSTLHLRGIWYPSSPGLSGMSGMVVRQLRHWIAILVALALIPVAATTMPGILTSLATCSLFRSRMEVDTASEVSVTWMSSTFSHTGEFPKGVGHRVENRWGLTKVAV